MAPRPELDDDADDELDEPLSEEPIGVQEELARVEARERALASAMGKGVRFDATLAPRASATHPEPSSAYRTVDPETLAERRLEEAHERLADLQVDRAIQEASEERERETRRALSLVVSVAVLPLAHGVGGALGSGPLARERVALVARPAPLLARGAHRATSRRCTAASLSWLGRLIGASGHASWAFAEARPFA